MGSNIEALERTFRQGRHAEAVSQCEATVPVSAWQDRYRPWFALALQAQGA
jgi:hypothetical protein